MPGNERASIVKDLHVLVFINNEPVKLRKWVYQYEDEGVKNFLVTFYHQFDANHFAPGEYLFRFEYYGPEALGYPFIRERTIIFT